MSSPPSSAATVSRSRTAVQRRPQLVVGGVGVGEAQVVPDRAGHDRRLLLDVGEAGADLVGGLVAVRAARRAGSRRLRFEEAQEQGEQRGLARARRADDRGVPARAGPPGRRPARRGRGPGRSAAVTPRNSSDRTVGPSTGIGAAAAAPPVGFHLDRLDLPDPLGRGDARPAAP